MSLEKQFKEDLNTIAQTIAQNINGIRTVTFNTVKGDIARRVFNNGISSDGSQIGQYAPSTKKQREKAGRQTARVDLEMSGTLRRSLVVGTESSDVVLGFTENAEPKTKGKKVSGLSDFLTTENAIEQEQRFNKDIFAPSPDEIEKSQKVFLNEVDRAVKKALGNKTIRIRKDAD